jgi:hypothetical protein
MASRALRSREVPPARSDSEDEEGESWRDLACGQGDLGIDETREKESQGEESDAEGEVAMAEKGPEKVAQDPVISDAGTQQILQLLQQMSEKAEARDQKIEQMNARSTAVEQKIEQMNAKSTAVEQKIEQINEKAEIRDKRMMEALEKKIDASGERIGQKITLLEEAHNKLENSISEVRKEIGAEKKEIRIEVTKEIQVEKASVMKAVNKIQEETELELMAVKRYLTELEGNVNDQLATKTDEVRSEVVNMLKVKVQNTQEQLGKSLEREKLANQAQLGNITVALSDVQTKLRELNSGAQDLQTSSISEVGETVHASLSINEQKVANTSNVSDCMCNQISCVKCAKTGTSTEHVPVCNLQPMSSNYLNHVDLPLPTFNDRIGTNPKFFIRQLDEYMNLRNVPKNVQLAIAYRSIVGTLGKQWIETIAHKLSNYEAFRQAFINHWWSLSQQSMARCSLYQDKFNKRSGLTMSAHFLKHATLTAYLEPRLPDREIIQAIQNHFPINVQRIMISAQLTTTEEALDLLKKIEVMEGNEFSHQSNPAPQYQAPNSENRNQYRPDQDWRRNNVRNMQFAHDQRREPGWRERQNGNGRNAWREQSNGRMENGEGRRGRESSAQPRDQQLNAHAQEFQSTSGQRTRDTPENC